MQGLLEEQLQAQQARQNYALVTIAEATGSTPRTTGKMIVYENGLSKGTVGGGDAEQQAKRDAAECIRTGQNALRQYDICAEDGTCTGSIRLLTEVFRPAPLLVVVGAGHVAHSLVQMAKLVGFSVLLADDRPMEVIRDTVQYADRFVPMENFRTGLQTLDIEPGASYVLATHSPATDCAALAAVLRKSSRYIGMVGSRRKVELLFETLRQQGFSEAELARVHAPIGLDIGGRTPPEIAVAILGEILAVQYGKRT